MKEIVIRTLVKATEAFPRHSEASFIQLADNHIRMIWMEYLQSEKGSEDNAPNRFSSMDSHDGGFTWTDKRIFLENDPGSVNLYSPNFLRLKSGEILFLYFKYLQLEHGKPLFTRCLLKRSLDNGRTFSSPETVWDKKPFNFASSVLKQTSQGRLLLPFAMQTGNVWSPTDHFDVGCMMSDDEGRTWTPSENLVKLPLRGCSEGHLEELDDGRICMVLRTQLGSVFKTLSCDGGRIWSKPQTTGLKSPESCPEIARIPGTGDLLMVWNHSDYDPGYVSHYGRRTPLSTAISPDEGRTWENIKDVESEPDMAYSNPICFFTQEGRLILCYWTTKYKEDGRMGGPIHLKTAVMDSGWLYSL